MQRFDINNSDWAALFRSKDGGSELFQSLVDNSDILNMDEGWAMTQGRIADAPTPTADDGSATFRMTSYKLEAAPVMDMRAPLGDSHQMDADGEAEYTASIPDFIGRGFVETAAQRIYKEKQFAQIVPQTDLKVVGVVGGGHLHTAGAEFHLGIVIRHNRNLLIDQRQNDHLADNILIAVTVWSFTSR